MTAWFPVDSSSWSFFGRNLSVADLGPYTGPWPLLSPGVVDAATHQTDFWVALPNPASPGDPRTVADDSYATDVYNAYRYHDTSAPPGVTDDQYWSGHTPWVYPGTDPSGLFVAGMHLYVVISALPPAQAPEFYVPAGYAAGGVASLMTTSGHWSGWQAGLEQSAAAFPAVTVTSGATDDTGAYTLLGDALPNLTVMAQESLDTIVAAARVADSSSSNLFSITVNRHSGEFPPGTASEVEVQASQWTRSYHADTWNPDPVSLTGLPAALVGANPATGQNSAFESADPAAFAWGAYHEGAGLRVGVSEPSGAGAGVGPVSHSVRVSQLPAHPVNGDPVPTPGGTLLGTVAITDTGVRPSFDVPFSLDLLPGTGPDVTLALVPTALYTGTADPAACPDFAGIGFYAWTLDVALGTPLLDYAFTTSRWRYWTPNLVVPSAVPSTAPTYLRMTQRNDGIGIGRHPRLRARQGSKAIHDSVAPRLSARGVYL